MTSTPAAILAAALGAIALLACGGCASLASSSDSRSAAETRAQARGFEALQLKAGAFELAARVRHGGEPAAELAIYIEGDGAAWPTPYHPPSDPTPRKPVSLLLATADPAPAVAYLGRPCQYLDEPALAACPSAYWIERRFAPEVIAAYDEAIDRLKRGFAARRVRLVGYSGGGIIAALLASRRQDVAALVTVAAPLALADWVTWHGASPLRGSLDPMSQAAATAPGVHFVGNDDKNVPVEIVAGYVRAKGGRVEAVAGFDHDCCWTREWANLLQRVPAKENAK